MPDKKLTDKEIVKAWNEEIHLANYVNENYRNCVAVSLIENTLDLINRLQAENSKSISNLTSLQNDLTDLQAENERLQKAIQVQEIMLDNQEYTTKKAKAEAYKEFAKLLDNKAMFPHEINDDYAVGLTTIDNLLKELVGEDK